ncbi:hypothetical protein DFP72DRAFT_61685 [Ephemerocybe angulata]|uniref:F-box domain-containing protein n=1 Tax=Ephemerocybe angulata TaxID=980116 RepID=A0A8H6HF19_9AGAR|nr:hypothetical protein DFP72DRAFT_61685 [Tulosesus angulatus]
MEGLMEGIDLGNDLGVEDASTSIERIGPGIHILNLAQELLMSILGELEYKDVMVLRRTCRCFRDLTTSKDVWRAVFLRLAETRLPRPFFLPKPLSACSAKDLEHAIANWEAAWPANASAEVTSHPLEPVSGSRVGLRARRRVDYLLGGRWALICEADASLWYFDLDSSTTNPTPKLLIPFEDASKTPFRSSLTLDYNIPDVSNTYHLSAFNLGMAVSWGSASNADISGVIMSVWRIETVFEHSQEDSQIIGKAVGLRAVKHLSSFEEQSLGREACSGFSLLGNHVAYTARRIGAPWNGWVAIVDWAAANGTTDFKKLLRWYVPKCAACWVFLLPGSRILIARKGDARFELYHWGRDSPYSTSPPYQQRFPPISPTWTGALPCKLYPTGNTPSRWQINGEVRITVPILDGTAGLRILNTPTSTTSTAMDEVMLEVHKVRNVHSLDSGNKDFLKARNMSLNWESAGYHRSLFSNTKDSVFGVSQHSWRDEHNTRPLRFQKLLLNLPIQYREDEEYLYLPWFDEFSRRVIFAKPAFDGFFVVHLR